jgi:photosystem II stability/assembly factor-like uncharacterized protein
LRFSRVASSDDGMLLSLSAHNGIYVSTNGGNGWFLAANQNDALCVASSASGDQLIYPAGSTDIKILRRLTGTLQTIPLGYHYWGLTACSTDGRKLMATGLLGYGGEIYVSTDLGATWTTDASPSKNWSALAMSAEAAFTSARPLHL